MTLQPDRPRPTPSFFLSVRNKIRYASNDKCDAPPKAKEKETDPETYLFAEERCEKASFCVK